MKKSGFFTTFLFLLLSSAAAAQPSISSLSASTLSRNGRLLIQGSGFGAAQGTSQVEIGGLNALVTRWSGTLIAAYVSESAPTGAATVRVIAGVASSTAELGVTLRQPNGRVKAVYFGKVVLGGSSADTYCYLNALDTGGGVAAIAPLLTSLTLTPNSVTGGAASTGQVTLSAPAAAAAAVISLSSSHRPTHRHIGLQRRRQIQRPVFLAEQLAADHRAKQPGRFGYQNSDNEMKETSS